MAAKKKRASRTEVRSATGGNQTKSTSFRGKARVVSSARSFIRQTDMNEATYKRKVKSKRK